MCDCLLLPIDRRHLVMSYWPNLLPFAVTKAQVLAFVGRQDLALTNNAVATVDVHVAGAW